MYNAFMLFTDHFFLFYFFPIFFIVFLLFHKKTFIANSIIIFFSLLFYASFSLQNIPILIIPLIADYFLGILLHKTKNKEKRKAIVVTAVVSNLLLLGFFKYLDFFLLNSINFITSSIIASLQAFRQSLIIPVGISFITFQRISYIVDIYRKKTSPEYNFISYATYATIFPHLIAGPIVKYTQIKGQLKSRRISFLTLFTGIKLFIVGLALKVLIADQLFKVEQHILANLQQMHTIEGIILTLYFSLRIYADFAGYSLMAIGIAKCIGFDFPQNFFAPYQSNNITTFWRRWNITLSLWLREYVYIPLGGNRKGKLRTFFNLILTMLLGGLWHGANWNFVIWGGLHGSYLVIEKFLKDKKIILPLPNVLKISTTFILVSITWLTFIFIHPSDIIHVLQAIFSFRLTPVSPIFANLFLWSIPSCLAAIIWSFFLSEEIIINMSPSAKTIFTLLILFMIALITTLQNTSVPFIYFQF